MRCQNQSQSRQASASFSSVLLFNLIKDFADFADFFMIDRRYLLVAGHGPAMSRLSRYVKFLINSS